MNFLDIFNIVVCIFYSTIGLTFMSLICLMFCGPYDYQDDDDSCLNIMSDTYQGNNRIFPTRKRANS
jgi:hypothetical protein